MTELTIRSEEDEAVTVTVTRVAEGYKFSFTSEDEGGVSHTTTLKNADIPVLASMSKGGEDYHNFDQAHPWPLQYYGNFLQCRDARVANAPNIRVSLSDADRRRLRRLLDPEPPSVRSSRPVFGL